MRKFTLGLLLVAVFIVFVSVSWSLRRSAMQEAANLKGIASLDVFSGRPNPTWDLSGTTVTALVTELKQLKTTPSLEGPDPGSRLGYRGFVVELIDQTSGEARRLEIYLGGIVETGMQTKFYVDPDRKTEELLLESARPHIDPDLYIYIELDNVRLIGGRLALP